LIRERANALPGGCSPEVLINMPVAPRSPHETVDTSPMADATKIREQLGRLLVHPLFANSKRYPALLAYTVEQTLLGNAGELKERSIAVEVFGRSPTYDANADPVVRITAGEVRKRLTQYYYDTAHRGELVIELPLGAYVPVFRGAERIAAEPQATMEPAETAEESSLQPSAKPSAIASKSGWWTGAAVLILLAAGVAAGWQASIRPLSAWVNQPRTSTSTQSIPTTRRW
jgi:hypothetical protein